MRLSIQDIKIWIGVIIGGFLFACSPGSPAKTSADAQAAARAVVVSVETAWTFAARACLSTASTRGDAGAEVRQACNAILAPARVQLEAADIIINGWGAATDEGALAAQLSLVVGAIDDALAVEGLTPGPEVQAAQTAALALVSAFVPSSSADGGVK